MGAILLMAPKVWGQDLNYGRYENLFGEAVTVSATGKPERVADTPVLMDLISADDIARSGSRDIPTLLHRLAGIDVAHASSSSQELGIGGYLQAIGSRVMVLINGRQIYFDGFGDVFWSSIPVELSEIRQIEVIHGAQSALYGFNAVDGVVNIITFDPVDDRINDVTARLGNHNRRDISAVTTQSLGNGAGVRLALAGDHAHDYGMVESAPTDASFQKNPNRRSASLSAGIDLADGDRINIEASHSDVSERAIVYDVFYNARIVSDSIKTGYIADTDIGRVNASVSYSGMQAPWVQTAAFHPFGVGDRAAVAQLSDLLKAGLADTLRFGLDARHDTLSAGPLTMGTLTGDLGSGSMMWEHVFSPDLTVVNAVRYDYFKLGRSGQPLPLGLYANDDFDRSIDGFSVNSSLIRRLTRDDALRLSFARGLKLPSLADFGQVEHFLPPYPGVYHYGNPDLQPTAVYDYQAGWDHQFRNWDIAGRMVIFHQMTMRHIGSPYTIVDGAIVEESAMATGSVANGATIDLRHKARNGLSWGVNYTFERLHEHGDLGFRDGLPTHKANANIGYGWEDWDADLALQYASATKGAMITNSALSPQLQVISIDSHVSLSPRVAWHANDQLTLELSADNLWPYRDSVAQRMSADYLLSVRLTY
ncbi:TonB-dependent receptor domain-containing protein [Telmatospirillum sp.]|uniref:TonB-dependent receptor plug domain-containing protein n=1 Tax=Telmatospirillum sp. TaxID=2079197 RepID=UPI00283C52AA|nr:TonB-dependent receptor [Telmatospirillum sp.]MDR3437587.1 TonB-dependent receptor [Telmatospirillum sp.]